VRLFDLQHARWLVGPVVSFLGAAGPAFSASDWPALIRKIDMSAKRESPLTASPKPDCPPPKQRPGAQRESAK
jgi:hypothetical protein